MTYKQLLAFATVAKHFSVARAAAELGVSQPSISKHLRLLEEAHKAKLFYRGNGSGIDLTDTGQAVLHHVHAILSRLEKLEQRFNLGFSAARSGSLTVAGTYAPSAVLLPRVLASFKQHHPDVEVSLRTHFGKEIEEKVLQGKVDIAVVNRKPHSRRIAVEPYGAQRLVAFAAANDPIARKRKLTLHELAAAPLIIRGEKRVTSTTEEVLRQLRDHGLRLKIAMRCDSSEAVKAAVRERLGVGILYYDSVTVSLKRGEFKALRLPGVNLKAAMFLIYHKERPLSANAGDFVALLRASRPRKNKSRGPA
ncbi:MAG: LysR family transcriptional regulator [Deltaproteobacteria bacterium]|nr:LysR family transcriptional regulator [Deltaproteobacteria bacterium]